jgi:dTDP-4-dehydrorhamnose 3,5-epimerase
MLFVPKGFAHGFCTIAARTEVMYKVDEYYSPGHDGGFRWNDPDIGIRWPVQAPILSAKDAQLPFFKDLISPF